MSSRHALGRAYVAERFTPEAKARALEMVKNLEAVVRQDSPGAAIGDEMTHGFDDQGRRFDADGNLRDWWNDADAKAYERRAQFVVDQFNGHVGVDTLPVKGQLTLGENIADLGGLRIAYAAIEQALAKKGRPGLIDGFTPAQRAQIW